MMSSFDLCGTNTVVMFARHSASDDNRVVSKDRGQDGSPYLSEGMTSLIRPVYPAVSRNLY